MPRGQSRTQGRPSAADIATAFRGVEYPCDKRELMDAAECNGADDDIFDMIEHLPDDEEFGGPQDVQEMIFGGNGRSSSRSRSGGRSQPQSRSRSSSDRSQGREPRAREDAGYVIIDLLHERGEVTEHEVFDFLENEGFDDDDVNDALDKLEDQKVCDNDNGLWFLREDDRSSTRRRERGRSGGYRFGSTGRSQGRRTGAEDPNPEQVSSRRRSNADLSDAEQDYEDRQEAMRGRIESDYDRRLRGHTTDAIADARAMRHGYDGRGRVTDAENDRRLGDHPSRAIDDARHMRHGYDGRGRVRKFGPGNVDESIDDDYQRYMENKRRREAEPEPDERGVFSRRRKFQGGGDQEFGSGRRRIR